MEQLPSKLSAILFCEEIINNLELQAEIQSVINKLNQIITDRKKKYEQRPTSPCPCGCDSK